MPATRGLKKDTNRAITPVMEAVYVPAHLMPPVSPQTKQLRHLHIQFSLGQSCHSQKNSCVYAGVALVMSDSSRPCRLWPARLLCQGGAFFLSHTGPGFQLWFYFHLCMWVLHWGLLLRLPWRTWVCPCEAQVWRWCSCLGHRGSGSARYSGELVARAAGNIVL